MRVCVKGESSEKNCVFSEIKAEFPVLLNLKNLSREQGFLREIDVAF